MIQDRVGYSRTARVTAITLALLLLAGCEEGAGGLSFLQPSPEADDEVSATPEQTSTQLIERDVEAPEIFQVTEAGLWDGRPSLGGVWVAHPDVAEPERVIIRNSANGQFVIGALFRRERGNPGPRLQASSDAAAALGMLAGAPVELNVTALRREAIPEAPEPEEVEVAETVEDISEEPADPITEASATLDESTVVAETTATTVGATPPVDPEVTEPEVEEAEDNTIETAALDALASTPAPTPAPVSRPSAAPTPTSVPSSLEKPFLQIGIFSVEANANSTAEIMRGAGMVPTVYSQSVNGKPFWRVVVGPARSTDERATLLRKIQDVGFTDAYPVTN